VLLPFLMVACGGGGGAGSAALYGRDHFDFVSGDDSYNARDDYHAHIGGLDPDREITDIVVTVPERDAQWRASRANFRWPVAYADSKGFAERVGQGRPPTLFTNENGQTHSGLRDIELFWDSDIDDPYGLHFQVTVWYGEDSTSVVLDGSKVAESPFRVHTSPDRDFVLYGPDVFDFVGQAPGYSGTNDRHFMLAGIDPSSDVKDIWLVEPGSGADFRASGSNFRWILGYFKHDGFMSRERAHRMPKLLTNLDGALQPGLDDINVFVDYSGETYGHTYTATVFYTSGRTEKWTLEAGDSLPAPPSFGDAPAESWALFRGTDGFDFVGQDFNPSGKPDWHALLAGLDPKRTVVGFWVVADGGESRWSSTRDSFRWALAYFDHDEFVRRTSRHLAPKLLNNMDGATQTGLSRVDLLFEPNHDDAYGMSFLATAFYEDGSTAKWIFEGSETGESGDLRRDLAEKGRAAVYAIRFGVDSADVTPDSEWVLGNIIDVLRADPSLRLRIEGHTDDTGTAEHNRDLSMRRAQAVMRYLVEQGGIEPGRLTARGFGSERPLAPNDTPEGRARNRRVELVRVS